jgi:hypothetical protein
MLISLKQNIFWNGGSRKLPNELKNSPMPCSVSAFKWCSWSLRARIPPCILGCYGFTLPSSWDDPINKLVDRKCGIYAVTKSSHHGSQPRNVSAFNNQWKGNRLDSNETETSSKHLTLSGITKLNVITDNNVCSKYILKISTKLTWIRFCHFRKIYVISSSFAVLTPDASKLDVVPTLEMIENL